MLEDAIGRRHSVYNLKEVETETQSVKERKERAEQIKRITQRLYALKPNPAYVAEHRATKMQVLHLRHVTRNSRVNAPHPSLSTIHNLSMDMVAAIKGARVRRTEEGLISRQYSVDAIPSRVGNNAMGTSSGQLRTLTSQMENVLSKSHTILSKDKITIRPRQPSLPPPQETPIIRFPKREATKVRLQLLKDMRLLSQKLRLVMSSLLLLEEDLKQCGAASQEKRKALQKRANNMYSMLDFLRTTQSKAALYVKRIDEAMKRDAGLVREHEGKYADLVQDILLMSRNSRVLDFLTTGPKFPEFKPRQLQSEQLSVSQALSCFKGRTGSL